MKKGLRLLFLLYASLGVGLWVLQERMLFFPQPVSERSAFELADKSTYFVVPGAVLKGWLQPASGTGQGPCQLLMYFGGNSEEVSIGWHAHAWHMNMAQLYVNYRGFGDSSGEPGDATMGDDALAVFDAVTARLDLPPESVCVIGRSMGSHPATRIAAHRDIARLVLITPFDSVLNMARQRFPIFPVSWMLRHPLDNLQAAPKVRARTLFVLAEKDLVVPHRYSRNLIEHWGAPYQEITIEGTRHNNVIGSIHYLGAVNQFLSPVRRDGRGGRIGPPDARRAGFPPLIFQITIQMTWSTRAQLALVRVLQLFQQLLRRHTG